MKIRSLRDVRVCASLSTSLLFPRELQTTWNNDFRENTSKNMLFIHAKGKCGEHAFVGVQRVFTFKRDDS